MPAVGDIPDSGMFKEIGGDDRLFLPLRTLRNDAWNFELERIVHADGMDPSRRDEHEALWARTQKETVDGWAYELGSIDDADAVFGRDHWRASRRFGVLQEDKIRPCDNMRQSLHNLASGLHETNTSMCIPV
jgi:hypothetical protein